MPAATPKNLAVELAIQCHSAAYFDAAKGSVDQQAGWIGTCSACFFPPSFLLCVFHVVAPVVSLYFNQRARVYNVSFAC